MLWSTFAYQHLHNFLIVNNRLNRRKGDWFWHWHFEYNSYLKSILAHNASMALFCSNLPWDHCICCFLFLECSYSSFGLLSVLSSNDTSQSTYWSVSTVTPCPRLLSGQIAPWRPELCPLTSVSNS